MSDAAVASAMPSVSSFSKTMRTAKRRSKQTAGTAADFKRAVLLPEKVLGKLVKWEAVQRFYCFFGIFLLYILYCELSSDWGKGRSSLDLWNAVRSVLGYKEHLDRVVLPEFVNFLDPELSNMTRTLSRACTECKVGVTSLAKSLSYFTLQDFICSDFDSTAGSDEYPARDCFAANVDYAMAPAADKAPCCGDKNLMAASMAIMAWNTVAPEILQPDFLSVGPVSLTDLLEIDDRLAAGQANGWSDAGHTVLEEWKQDVFTEIASRMPPRHLASRAGIHSYVYQSINNPGEPILQLIISQQQRMLGIEYYAEWLDKTNSPGVVVPSLTYWSLDPSVLFGPYAGGMIALAIISILNGLAFAFDLARTGGSLRFAQHCASQIMQPWAIFCIFVIVAPLVVALVSDSMAYSTSNLMKCILVVLMSLRVFVECEVIEPLNLVIRPVINAAQNLAYMAVVVVFLSVTLAIVYGMLFGVFDHELTVSTTGLARMIKMLTSSPSLAEDHMEQSLTGALLMYYWCTFFVRLVFGSFTVAILVGSFNSVKAELAKEAKERKSLPEGYARLPARHLSWTARRIHGMFDILWYMLTWRAYGGFVPQIERALRTLLREGCKEVSEEQLFEKLGHRAATRLMRIHGVVPPETEAEVELKLADGNGDGADDTRRLKSPVGDATEKLLAAVEAAVDARLLALSATQEELTAAVIDLSGSLKKRHGSGASPDRGDQI